MEVFLALILLVILILLVNVKSSLMSRFDALQRKVDSLLDEQKKMRGKDAYQDVRSEQKAITKQEDTITQHQYKTPEIKPELVKPEEKTAPEVKKEEVKKPETLNAPEAFSVPKLQPVKPAIVQPPKPPKPGFFERNPDLEKFIGENLANKIGIGILVLGIGFFVKYAIDQDWINEIGRVFIGILCGGILLGVAHRLRKTFKGFSSVLVGGGIAVLYLTIAIAFHEYEIFSQTTAFILMLVITGFAVALSLGYNRMELAVLSILGGFASPFMVSTGEGNYVVLFTYILILDAGMLVLAYYKKWNLVNIIAYVFTVILFGSWLGSRFDGSNGSMIWGSIIFSTLFYLVFFAMNIINNIKERTAFKTIEITLLLSNTFFYYAAGMVTLNNEAGEIFRGLFTAGLGVFNFVFAYTLYKNSRVDRNLVFLLIGLVLTFISLAAPVQLKGNYITLFWAAETVLLLWLSQKSGIRLMKISSVLLMVLMLFSLLMDWQQIYLMSNNDLTIIFNKGYVTGLVALISIGITRYLLKNEDRTNSDFAYFYATALLVVGIILLYCSQLLELRHQLFQHGFDFATQNIIIGCYNMLFISGLVLADGRLFKDEIVSKLFAFLGVAAMLMYLFYYHWQIVAARDGFFLSGISSTGFVFHYILVCLLLFIAGLTLKRMQGLTDFNEKTYNLYSWFYVFFFVFIASAELDHTVLLLTSHNSIESIDHVLSQNHKIGYPILWGVTSFILIAFGLKMRKRHLRIISLTLFLVTLLKLFFVDIKGISEGGKIAAFISLGILLLIVSFMYQRLKKILLADEPVEEKSNGNPS